MLQRHSSRKGRLGHRKSTSSFPRHERIDPEVARQQAQTAATLAFARANARKSADGGISRNKTLADRLRSEAQPTNSNTEGNVRPIVRRQQSVRFVGPSAVPRRQALTTSASQLSITPKINNAQLRPRAVTTDTPVPAQYRPPSRSSSIGKASVGKSTNIVAALAYDEYYTQEDDVASTPSSYRKIRKSKSMFSPLRAPSVFYTNGTPDGQITRDDLLVEPSSQNSGLKAPKSMSFLRGGREHIQPGTRQRHDVAVQIARDKFLHNVEQQRLKAQPSFLFRSRKARETREEKSFRKSVRSSSYGDSITPTNAIPSAKESGLMVKARKASEKIKNKLKKVFGQSRDGIIPFQQVEASETHVRRYNGDDDLRHGNFIDIPRPTDEAVSRVASRVPSIHAMNSEQQLRSISGSVQSMRSESISDDKSRVTSWATTNNNNTISSQSRAHTHAQAQYEADRREQQRLSIINEHGTHHSSATFSHRPMSNQNSAYPVIHSQRSGTSSQSHYHAQIQPTVDSARVYSALMKRLNENSPQAKLEASRKASADSFHLPDVIPPRSSSLDRRGRSRSRSHGRTTDTIRHIPTDFDPYDDGRSNASGTSIHQHGQHNGAPRKSAKDYEQPKEDTMNTDQEWLATTHVQQQQNRGGDDVFSSTHQIESGAGSTHQHPGRESNYSAISRKQSIKSYHTAHELNDQQLLDQGMSPQEIALENEPVIAEKPKKTIRESRSTFFGSTEMTLPRTTSPYRRALAERDYNPAAITENSPVHLLIPLRKPLLFSTVNKENTPSTHSGKDHRVYSESLYSRTTSGRTPLASTSTLVLPFENHPSMPTPNPRTGDAVVMETATYQPSNLQSRHRPSVSSASSDWRGWMSNQVSMLESKNRDLKPDMLSHGSIPYRLPTMPVRLPTNGHVREFAQINGDGTEGPQHDFMVNCLPLDHDLLLNMQENIIDHTREGPLGIAPQRNVSNFINDLRMNGPKSYQNRNTEKTVAEREPSPAGALMQQNMPVLKPILKKSSTLSLSEPSVPRIPTPPPMPPRSPLRQMQNKGTVGRTPSIKALTPGSAKERERSVPRKRSMSQSTFRSIETSAGNVGRRERNVLHKRNTSQSTLRSLDALTKKMSENGSPASLKSLVTPAKLVKRYRPNSSVGSRTAATLREKHSEYVAFMDHENEGLDAQQMGSKRMVDLFLSSRRRQITGGSASDGNEGVNLTPTEVFL
ncbi:hypothetical protein BP5796_09449 [Coleophoma crateriformis]|uniref:Uncharacterized protein n=1 Tax=Coleophoma crateriformis TaxID=565419 RepID=A0A3D8QYC9_9HELO|nr:hypothetical protein BP5796_09449 [Coleophoma crateriformis]